MMIMENKINIAELLKDCLKGMELDCAMYDNCTLEIVFEGCLYPIQIQTPEGLKTLTKYGSLSECTHSKCVIFPKGKTTWDGFQRPFKDGNIIYNRLQKRICIYHCREDETSCISYCRYNEYHKTFEILSEDICIAKQDYRFATEEEKQKLFKSIKDNGYKWNAETKTLEKLVQPIFEVGNKIEKCGYRFTIAEVKDDYYLTKCGNKIPIDNQGDFSLVPNKFDIATLKPLESKVLIRDYDDKIWVPTFWGKLLEEDSNCRYLTSSGCYKYCIPYEGNEHLLGTTNDCDEYFKTWK